MAQRFAGQSRSDLFRKVGAKPRARVSKAWARSVIERAYAADPGPGGSLDDIEHFVLLMQENRSFDHYYGTLSGVRGFDDISTAFRQYGWSPGKGVTADGYLNPFRLDTTRGPALGGGDSINDPTHDWGPQHRAWNNGLMDQWVNVHVASEGPRNGPATMGYYTRADIPTHRDLADAFTICDHYFSSVMGPTDPNRLYWVSGTIDPDGLHGGPLVETPFMIPRNKYSWPTYPEALQDAGVSWKVYQNKDFGPLSSIALDGMLGCFTKFQDPNSELHRRGIQPTYPHDFAEDVKNDRLPSVSWIVPSLLTCEHPALPAAEGAVGILQVLQTLTSNPKVWEKTALIVSYDENGGFFDHVPPPVAPPGTPGEYLTVPLAGLTDAEGIAGPIGLGFRVPCLIMSPYTRGGLVASDIFDHTSQLRLLEKRFGVPVPNLSQWRRETVGDMSTAFNFATPPNDAVPTFKDPKPRALCALLHGNINILLGFFNMGIPYKVPANAMPTQEKTPLRGRPQQ